MGTWRLWLGVQKEKYKLEGLTPGPGVQLGFKEMDRKGLQVRCLEWELEACMPSGRWVGGSRLMGEAQRRLTIPRADKKGLISEAFSNGVALGIGVTTIFFFLCLCLFLVIMKTLGKKQTQAETPTQAETRRPRITRRSTILDYINVVPDTGPLARNRNAKPSSPFGTPPADADSPQSKNSQELRCVSHGGPAPKAPPQAPGSGNNEEELHYAALNFPGLRPRDTQESKDTGSEYAEIRFH